MVTETQDKISNLTMELESLGKPGSMMSAGFSGGGMDWMTHPYGIGTRETFKEQSVGHISERTVAIPKEIKALEAKLKELKEFISPPTPATPAPPSTP